MWSSKPASRTSDKIIGGISYHPSVVGRLALPIADYGDAIKVPQIIINTLQETVDVKENSTLAKRLTERFPNSTVVKTYPDQSHGFMVRGNLSNVNTSKAYLEAMQITYQFLEKVHPVPVKAASNVERITSGIFACFASFLVYIFI